MAIEFRCTKCNKLLRTADDTAGKHAKCPECGEILLIPSPASTIPPLSSGGSATPPPQSPPPGGGNPFASGPQPQYQYEPDSGNPYQSPNPFSPMPTTQAAPGEIRPTIIDLGDVMGRTWEIYKREWGTCLVLVLIIIGCNFGFSMVFGVANNIIVAVTRNQEIAALFSVFTNFILQIFQAWITIGQIRCFLRVARGQPVEYGEIFSGGPWLLRIIGASILYGLMVLGGVLLLIVPGIILALMFGQYYYLIVDRDMGVMDSLKTAKQITDGNKLTLFLMALVCFGLTLAGLLVLCVGVLAVAPYIALLQVMAYLTMTGQPTVDQMQMGQRMY
jgi:phage FluMu protein Com